MRVAVVGATGLVGQVMCDVLAERQFPITAFYPVASHKSVGKTLEFKGVNYKLMSMEEAVDQAPDIALFSAGGAVSREWAPRFVAAGCTVIDNSSAWRMEPDIKLIVPEVNAQLLESTDKIIANPNCSTIQMVMVLAPLHRAFGIDRIIVSTYQSITGTGVKAVRQYEMEKGGFAMDPEQMAYHYPIFGNCIPHCDVFLDNDYTKEEMKLVQETRKIMSAPELRITATAVRVPVQGGHSESVNVSFHNPISIDGVRQILEKTAGVVVQDDYSRYEYPMPLTSQGKNEVFVGRLRLDESNPNTLNCWIVADNLRKGAATNAVQIAEFLHVNRLVGTIHV